MGAMAATREGDGYFLSATNPIANVDQREVEDRALRLVGRPEIAQARKTAAFLWLQVMEYAAGPQMARFESMMDQFTFNYLLKAVNSDANFPKVVRILHGPGRWFGRDTPGARWGGDNPDNAYRIVPIAGAARYELQGRTMPGGVANVTYTIVANTATSVTLASLEGREVKVAADGTFNITIDAQPAAGRANHLQNKPEARYLFVRDSLGDWDNETPNALRIRRLDAATRDPLTDDEIVQRAARYMVDDVYLLYWFTRLNYNMPPNVMRTPRNSGAVGGLRTQSGSQGLLRLADDEAMIITANAAGAAYRGIVLHDVWYLTIDPWKIQSSLVQGQMAANADGEFTYVVAHRDPGVFNWLDTGALNEIYALHRWQGLPAETAAEEEPQIRSQVVKLGDLKRALPAGVRTVTPDEREQQLARRRAGFARRFVDD